MKKNKYKGIFPAFYACYDEKGEISPDRVQAWTKYLIDKKVNGLYVGGSSGECIYQSVEERKILLENVMKEAEGKLTVIAHVACNNTADSRELAAHAEQLGVDAIAAIPPIYFHLPAQGIVQYWTDISNAAPHTDFIIYNIPQLAGVPLTLSMLQEMLKLPRCIGVKNSSMPVQDIQMWNDAGAIVFNGPDEQLLSGLAAGAVGGIGGTYGVMPELYLKIYDCYQTGNLEKGRELQNECCRIIYKMCLGVGNLYAIIKECIRRQGGPDIGGVRAPLTQLVPADQDICQEVVTMIEQAKQKYCL